MLFMPFIMKYFPNYCLICIIIIISIIIIIIIIIMFRI